MLWLLGDRGCRFLLSVQSSELVLRTEHAFGVGCRSEERTVVWLTCAGGQGQASPSAS